MRRPARVGAVLAAGLALAVVLAVLVSPWASSAPDGLERVAVDEGFADGARTHALADAPTADYGVAGIDDERVGTGLAGLVGLVVTGGLTGAVLWLVRGGRRRPPAPASTEASAP